MKKLFIICLFMLSLSVVSCSSGWSCKARYVKQDKNVNVKFKHDNLAKRNV